MLNCVDLEDKENVASVTCVIKAVLDGVKVGPLLMDEDLFATSEQNKWEKCKEKYDINCFAATEE